MTRDTFDGYGCGRIHCFWFRWHECAKPGRWIITIVAAGFVKNLNAVVDDFGNLVVVA